MNNQDFSRLFQSRDVDSISVHQLADWQATETAPRLHLAPIQRSLVWTNEQVVAFWDSLLRGYPPGMIMVHRTQAGDFDLFDGQQRLNAILLGINPSSSGAEEGRRLWIDLASDSTGDFRLALRVNTHGQPFGYRQEEPNSRIELKRRREKFLESAYKDRSPTEIFNGFKDKSRADLIGARCAVALSVLLTAAQDGNYGTITEIVGADVDLSAVFKAARTALNLRIVLLKLPCEIVRDQDSYIRFFGRVGQGGTRLSDPELVYSIIKQRYPIVRKRMKSIIFDKDGAGRLIGEVDLVLAALRTARATNPVRDKRKEEGLTRPVPEHLRTIHFEDTDDQIARIFKELLPEEGDGKLLDIMTNLRKTLEYNLESNPDGIPRMLLARLDKNLIDVLILWFYRNQFVPKSDQQKRVLIAFVLYWLIFVDNSDRTANRAFRLSVEEDWKFGLEGVANLISDFEKQGTVWRVPTLEEISRVKEVSERHPDPQLRSWGSRFPENIEAGADRDANNILRRWAGNRQLAERTLMWLQREYLTEVDPHYDPTSSRDEDLPVELDHLIPSAQWYHWGAGQVQETFRKNFRDYRSIVGDSIGKFSLV